MSRRTKRIDYRKLNETGERHFIEEPQIIPTIQPVTAIPIDFSHHLLAPITHPLVSISTVQAQSTSNSTSIQGSSTTQSTVHAQSTSTKGSLTAQSTVHAQSTASLIQSTSSLASLSTPSSQNLSSQLILSSTSSLADNCSDTNMDDQEVKTLMIQQKVIASEIVDFINENQIEDSMFTVEEVDEIVAKIESIRKDFKTCHYELEEKLSEEEYEPTSKSREKILSAIRNFIYDMKLYRRKIRSDENQRIKCIDDAARQSKRFLLNEIQDIIPTLFKIFETDPSNLQHSDLLDAKTNVVDQLKTMKTLSCKVREVLCIEITDFREEVDKVTEKYHQLCSLKQKYVDALNAEIKDAEVSKQQSFQSSKFNIKLPKFKGYDTFVDVYTFQSDFEKLHLKSTPKSLLADLLKNNFLEGPALTLVKGVDSIDEIWKRLKSSYGDPKMLLSKKLSQLDQSARNLKHKDPEKQIDSLSRILNFMKDSTKLATEHDIRERLYYGGTIEKIYKLLDEQRVNKWFTLFDEEDLDEPDVWKKLINFLEKEITIQQRKLLYCTTNESKNSPPPSRNPSSHYGDGQRTNRASPLTTDPDECFICGATDHVKSGPKGMKLVQYFSCPRFAEMTPAQRFSILWKKGLCHQCLYPGAHQSKGKHCEGRCQRDFICPHHSHEKYPCRNHVLVCQKHAGDDANQQVLQSFKDRCMRQPDIPTHAKEIKLTFHSRINDAYLARDKNRHQSIKSSNKEPVIDDNAIYILQTIKVDGKRYTIFFDLGCSDMIIRKDAAINLKDRSHLEFKGEIVVGGVGQSSQTTNLGVYCIQLPLRNGHDATLSGVCLSQITMPFPIYPLDQVEQDIHTVYRQNGKNPLHLPTLPPYAGGEIDIMLGIKYLKYHPQPIFQLPSGLTIYESVFQNADGGFGVVGGPHRVFNTISNDKGSHLSTFITNQFKMYQAGILVNPDVPLLHIKTEKDHQHNLLHDDTQQMTVLISCNQKIFERVEQAGTIISYRCVKCRECTDCKENESTEAISIKEEVEQHLINQSVTVDPDTRESWATLPLLHNPEIKLAPNKDKALKIYHQQLKKLNQAPVDKADVIKAEKKLQSMGFVDYVRNMSEDQQQMLANNNIQNFIPWRAVWNGNSLSTPCRIVFDASHPTKSGYSLNSILAKGTNNMNKLVEIFIRWTSHHTAYHTDIRKMYNTVKLKENHWCLQRYVWQEELDHTKIPEEKIIKTLIYGVKSSGNQSERALRETSKLFKDQYPDVFAVIHKDVYVDDCLSGAETQEGALNQAERLETVLNKGGFSLKGITFSKQDPNHDLSKDGESINVAGMKWYPKQDLISLDIGELNFAKKSRGKKPTSQNTKDIPIKLTRRQCVAKVAEVYDITGKITPITAGMKLDLHHLIERGLQWDDQIPDDLRHVWEDHFQMMGEISSIKYKRAIVPDDATSLDISTIDFGDASKSLVCVAIYARFKRKFGNSCQLVFSRSRLVPDDMTLPRAELYAATLNAHTGEVVRRSFTKHHKSSLKLSDSQITLFWINGDHKQLKPYVKN
ncbi:MAG: hypothetical protein AAF587_43730 [Bacteroidota bacterium]